MILFIDDEVFFNESYVEALKSAKYDVVLERDITKALDFFHRKKYEIQLVILDVMMEVPNNPPEGFNIQNSDGGFKTGIEVLRLLNKEPNSKHIPKIILTNVAEESFLSKYANSNEVAGCYTKKDTDINKLVEIVTRIVRKN